MSIATPDLRIDDRVKGFIDSPRKLLIDGQWVEAASGKTFPTFNPATGEVCAQVADASLEDVQCAFSAAIGAKQAWACLSHTRRAAYLLKAADIMEQRQQDLVDALVEEGGSWIGKAMFETGYSIEALRAAAAMVFHMNGEVLPSEHGKVSMAIRLGGSHFSSISGKSLRRRPAGSPRAAPSPRPWRRGR